MSSLKLIVCLFVALSLLPICTSALSLVTKFDYDYSFVSTQLCLMELREVLLIAYDINVSDSELMFRYKGNECILTLVNNKILLKPGTQIIVGDVDAVRFYTRGNAVIMTYKRKNKEYETVLCQAKGIHLPDFYSDNDDDLNSSDLDD